MGMPPLSIAVDQKGPLINSKGALGLNGARMPAAALFGGHHFLRQAGYNHGRGARAYCEGRSAESARLLEGAQLCHTISG
jgi:hypothetical protein